MTEWDPAVAARLRDMGREIDEEGIIRIGYLGRYVELLNQAADMIEDGTRARAEKDWA